jgi:hypothetical protein
VVVFPQLATGASALYPVIKRSVQRTVLNTLSDGRKDAFADADGVVREWELRAAGLTPNEWDAIESLFQTVSGRWQTFTFLDPTANLLLQSENFGGSAWTNGALIQLTTGIADPLGTTRATRVVNAGIAVEAAAQTLSVPGSFQYCLSVWARSTGGSSVTLALSTTGGSIAKTFALSAQWRRVALAGNLGLNTTAVTFGAQLEAGASVDLFGMQAEAQLAPSDYKRNEASGGVYAKARFAEDQLTVRAQGTEVYDAVIKIVDTEG